MSVHLIRIARINVPFSNGPVVGQCTCGAVVHKLETHLPLANGAVLCAGCTADRLQDDLVSNERAFVSDVLHVVEPTPEMIEVYYASLGETAI